MSQSSREKQSVTCSFSMLCGLILGLLCLEPAVSSQIPCDSRTQFTCKIPPICISLSRVRDGTVDCPDGSDEECPFGMHRCACGVPRCIEKRLVGDGIQHCMDGSDEGEDNSNFLCPDPPSRELLLEAKKNRRKRQTGFQDTPVVRRIGKITAFTGTEVNGDVTTLHTTRLHGTFTDGTYTQVYHTSSTILPTPAAYIRKDQDKDATPSFSIADQVQKFGSLSSGRVYRTAVNEPVSSLSTSIPDVKMTPKHSNEDFNVADSQSRGLNNEALPEEGDPIMEITGSLIPNMMDIVTRRLVLDVSAKTIGTQYPNEFGDSVISVTGTQGTFIHRDEAEDKTYPVFTGSYVRDSRQPTTYMFFFGDSPLTSDVKVIVPTKTFQTERNTPRAEAYHAVESGQKETRSGGFKAYHEQDAPHHVADVNVNNLLQPSIAPADATPVYGILNTVKADATSLSPGRPIAITRYIQPTARILSGATVLTSTNKIAGGRMRNPKTSTLRGHPDRYKYGRMYNPTTVAGRRVHGTAGATIITDQFFFPGHRRPQTSNAASASSYDYYDDENDDAFYEGDGIPLDEQDLGNEFRKVFEGQIARSPSGGSFSDKRLTRTVGLYGPIYEADYETNQQGPSSQVNQIHPTISELSPSEGDQEVHSTDGKTVTLFGFAKFSTKISGTNYVFVPASSQPKTFTPRVTRTQGISEITDFFNKGSSTHEQNVFFRRPVFGTETREFISQTSMFTSTVKEPIEMQKTMFTSTVVAKQPGDERTRDAKLGETVEKAIITVPQSAGKHTLPSIEYGISKEKSSTKNFMDFNNQMANENTKELDVTEIVDDIEEFGGLGITPQPTGLVSSFTGSEVANGMTTHWTTLIFGTYIDNTYAHIIESTSSIFFTVSKTALPFETLVELSESQENPHSYDGNSKSTTTFKHESKTTSLPRENDQILSSLNDIPSDKVSESVVFTESLSSIRPVEILTSGFFLPNQHPSENYHTASNSRNEEILEPTEGFEEHSASEESPTDLKKIGAVTPGVVYVDEDEGNIGVSTESLDMSIKSQDISTPTESLQILTDGFILPIGPGNREIISPVENPERSFSSEFLSLVAERSSDVLINDGTMTPIESKSDPLEFIINNRKSDAHEGTSVEANNTVRGILDSPRTETSDQLTVLESANAKTENTIDGHLTTATVLGHEEENKLKQTESPSDVKAIITPAVVYADDTSSSMGETPSIVLLTGDFILPRHPSYGFEKSDYLEEINHDSHSSSILTNGFILPDLSEVSTKTENMMDTSIPSPLEHSSKSEEIETSDYISHSKNMSQIESSLSILTSGFILPKQEANAVEKKSGHDHPSSALLVENLTPADENGDEMVESPIDSTPSGRNAGDSSKIIVNDDFILPTPTTTNKESHILNDSESSRGNGDSVTNDKTVQSASESGTKSSNDRMGKSMEFDYQNPQDRPKVEELLPSISYPITYYTTSTYFTTFLVDGRTVVSSTESTASQVYTDGDHLRQAQTKQPHPAYPAENPGDIKPSSNGGFSTFFTTFTYYTTFLRDGSKVVTSSEETKTQLVPKDEATRVTLEPSYTVSTYPTTYYTTLTYFTTLLRGGSQEVITNQQVVSNVVTPSVDLTPSPVALDHGIKTTSSESPIRQKPTTYYTTYTYYTTFLKEGTTSVNTRHETVSNILHGTITSDYNNINPTTTKETEERSFPSTSEIKPTTYFTTYTYYTTYLRGGSTVVSSREEVVSSIFGKTSALPLVTDKSTKDSSSSNPLKTTFYTTYTYYTTLLKDGTTTVETRKETISDVRHGKPSVSATSVEQQFKPPLLSTPAPKVKTHFTTYTYFTTFLRDASSIISSRESTVTNVFTESSPSVSTSQTALNVFPTRVFATYFTTLTSYFTLFSEGTPSISTVYSTLTDVVALSTPESNNFPGPTNAHIPKLKPTTSTYTTVYTYFTTLLNQGTPVVSSREQTMTNVVILPASKVENINKPTTIVHAVTTLTSLNKKSTDSTPFLVENVLRPFYTTYTYFTTFFRDGSPSVSTRYDTITDYTLGARPHISVPSTTRSQGLIAASLEKDFHDHSSNLPNDAPHPNASPVIIYSTRTLEVTDSKDDTHSPIQIVSSLHGSLDSSRNGVPSQNGFEVKELYTTHTYFTTYFPHGFPVVESRIETVKNTPSSEVNVEILATKEKLGTDLDAAEGEFHEKRVQPTISSTYNSTNNPQDANTFEEIETQFSRKEVTASAVIEHEFNNSDSAINSVGTTPETEHITTTIFPSTLDCCSSNQLPTSTYRTVTLFITNYDKGSPVVITRIETLTAALDSLVSNIAHTISSRQEVSSNSVPMPVNANIEEHQPARPRKAYENVTEEYSVSKQYSNKSTSDISLLDRLLNSSIPLQISNEDKISTIVTTKEPPTSEKSTEEIPAKEGSTIVLEETRSSSLPMNAIRNAFEIERVSAVDMATVNSVEKAITNPPSVDPDEEKGSDSKVTAQSQDSSMETTLLKETTQILTLSEITTTAGASTKIDVPISTTTETSNETEILTTTEVITTTEVPTTTGALRRSIFSRRRNRPSYRPNTLTRSPKTTLSSTTRTTTTTTTKSPTTFTRRNSSRLLFRRPTVANRTFPIRRLRTSQLPPLKENSSLDESIPSSSRRKRSFFSPSHFEEMPKLRRLLNTRDEDTAIKNNDLIYSDTKVNNGEVAVRSGGDEHHISPRQNSKDVQPTGLLRSLEARAVTNGVTTIYATEIYGTYINGAYAQIVHSATRVLSDTPNEIFRTSMNLSPSHLATSAISHEAIKEVNSQKVGLVSSIINTSVREGTTTLHKTNIYGTYVGSVYAHIAQTTTSVISPTPISQNAYPTGLISSSIRSQIDEGKTIVWTTQIYGTFVNGYYAHVASTSSRNLSPQSSSPSHSSRETDNRIGLLSSLVSDHVVSGITTLYTTNIFGTFIGEYYAQHAITSSRILTPSSTATMSRSVGLVSTILNSVVNENTATLFKTEVYGTYIGQHYAQIAKTSTEVKILPSKQFQSVVSQTPSQKTGLITSSILRSEVNHGVTTLHMNEIYGTYIGNAYAHVARSTSRVIYPTETTSRQEETTSQKTGLISSRVRTEVNEGTTTLHIAEIHGTYIGNYYAHVAKRTSTVLPFTFIASTSTPQPPTTTNLNLEGLVSSQLSTEINDGTTTLHTREIYGTSINGYYAHIARSTSNVIKPTVSTKVDAPTIGLLSSITSSEFNNGMLTLHTTEIYGTRINGFYAHIARSTSNVMADPFLQTFGILPSVSMEPSSNTANWLKVENGIPKTEVTGRHVDDHNQGSSIAYELDSYSAMITNSFAPIEARQTMLPITARDDLDTARVNHVDRDNHDLFPTTKGLYSSTFIDHVSALNILSPSFNSDNVLEVREKQMSTPVLSFDKHSTKIADIHDSSSYFKPALSNTLVPDSHYKRQDQITTSQEKPSITVTPTQLENQRQNSEKSDSKDYNYDFDDDSSLNSKESGIKSHSSSENYKSRTKSRPPEISLNTDENESENDYDEYDFEGDYDDYNSRKEHEKTSSVLTSSVYGASRASFTNANQQGTNNRDKTSVYNEKQYDDYEDEFDDSEVSDETFSKSKEAQSTKDLPSTSVRIRPFVGRGRPTFSTPARTTTKPTFTIQFRRPSRVRNSRANSQRSDNENNDEFDDDLRNEEDEGDIEASEAVVTSATPQVLPFKRKPFGNQRYQPLARTQPGSTTTSRPVNINRSRRIFGRSSTNPSPTPSLKDHVSDYEENTTEDDDFDNFDDINYKEDNGGVNRGSRSTRRPSSIFPRTSDRRNGYSKRGSQRHREDEEVENDDLDSTTPDYRNSRNRLQRKPNRNRYNRNRSPSLKASPNSVSRDEDEDSQLLQPITRPRVNNNRRRQSYNPRTRRPTKTATETKSTMNKPHLTITSVVTTVKTLPIYHGFRTSFATLTTTALDTSIIRPSQYSTVVTDGITKTLFFSKVGIPDGLENFHTTITEVVVTTTSLASIKLVPIKIGFSTRTDTVTDIQVLTTLSTVYSTISPDTPIPTAFPQQFQPPFFPQIGPPNPDFGLLTSANSFITTHIVTSTTVIPIVSRGRTILSTLTTTSTAESVVIQTATIRVPQVPSPAPFIPQPYFAFQPITTLLTLYVTGEYGELKPVVTTVTVPVYQQPVFHTKVARSLQSAASDHQIDSTKHPDLVFRTSTSGDLVKNAVEIDTHYDKLLSSGLEEIDDMSEMSSTYSPTEPLGATIISSSIGDHLTQDITTISKGPLIEIYEQKATVHLDGNSRDLTENEIESISSQSINKYGIESSYNFRKLQQFTVDEPVDFRPQRDFTRIRRIPQGVIRESAVDPRIRDSSLAGNDRSRLQPQVRPLERYPDFEAFTGGDFRGSEQNVRQPLRGRVREGSAYQRLPPRLNTSFRPFIEVPRKPSFSSDVAEEEETYSSPGAQASSQPPSDLRQLGGLLDSLRNANDEIDDPNNFSGSPLLEEKEGFKPLTALDSHSPENPNVTPTRILRVVRPNGGAAALSSNNGRRIIRTRIISPTAPVSSPEEENELTSKIPEKSENFNTFPFLRSSTPSVSADSLQSDNSHSSPTESALKNSPYEDSNENEDNDHGDSAGLRRTIVRRLKPSLILGDGSGSRRPVIVRRTRVNSLVTADIRNPAIGLTSADPVVKDRPLDISESTNLDNPNIDSDDSPPSPDDENDEDANNPSTSDRKPLKKIIRLRKPEVNPSAQNGQRRRVVVTRRPQDITESQSFQGRGLAVTSALHDEEQKSNLIANNLNLLKKEDQDLDDFNKIGNIPGRETNIPRSVQNTYSTVRFPLTYFTTLTYYTTFVRGTNVAYASREAVFSNVLTQTLDPHLISVIRSDSGILSPTNANQIMHLASRTLGDTTTLVNLASRQSVYNRDVDYLLKYDPDFKTPNPVPTRSIVSLTSTLSLTQLVKPSTLNINAIASLPKTYVTLFTYIYTFYDGIERRESTRAETITNVATNPSQFSTESIGSSIDGFGYLPVEPETRTVHLGSRRVEGTATEVNLGLKTIIHFSGLRNIVLERNKPFQYITPSRTVLPMTEKPSTDEIIQPSFEPSKETTLTPLEPSYVSANELFGSDRNVENTKSTPLIPSESTEKGTEIDKYHEKVLKVTSVIHKPSGPLRSGVFTPRPGVRVRVRPAGTKRKEQDGPASSVHYQGLNDHPLETIDMETFDPSTSDVVDREIPTPVVDSNYAISDADASSSLHDDATEGGHENELISEDYDATHDGDKPSEGVTYPRKRLKITVRRPQSGSVSRTHTRFVLPSRFEITSRPRFYVVTRTGALGVVSPTQQPFTVKISRKVKSTQAESEDLPESTTVIYDTFTTLTSVPVIFGLDTSFRNVLLTTSSAVTVSEVSPTFVLETPALLPSHSVVLTYFTTTTFTIPYVVGDQTIFTTIEETNSRVVIQTFDGLDSITYSTITRPTVLTEETTIPTLSTMTNVEYGIDEFTTHFIPSESTTHSLDSISTVPSPLDSITFISPLESTTVLYDTQTFFTTYTFFTTFFTGTDSFVSSYEQVVSNVITVPVTMSVTPTITPEQISDYSSPTEPLTLFDTSEHVTTSTSYRTVTFYATLFNDTMSFVTPIEEVQTEVVPITETYTITRTVLPTPSLITSFPSVESTIEEERSVVVTQTLYTTYTNFVTLFQGSDSMVSSIEEVVTDVVTITVAPEVASSLSVLATPTLSDTIVEATTTTVTPKTSQTPIYTTREILSTQTHYLTLFNGDEQLLSSIEEVITSHVTEIVPTDSPSTTPQVVSTSSIELETETYTTFVPRVTTEEEITETFEEIQTYQPELVPSIRTIYSTLTFYTTYYSDTSSIVASQEEILTSYVTLFVPPSLITSTESSETTTSSSSISTPVEPIFVFTTTDYSTHTLYTTLFSGDETLVISSEQVVPEVITATITPSSTTTTHPSPSAESVLTFLTTFTYYTTYFSGNDAVIASSESVVTQFVTIEAGPTSLSSSSSINTSLTTSPVDETILGISTNIGGDIYSSFKDDLRDTETPSMEIVISSSIIEEIEPVIIGETSVVSKIDTKIHVESKIETRVHVEPTAVFETVKSFATTSSFMGTSTPTSKPDTISSSEERSPEGRGIRLEESRSHSPDITDSPTIISDSEGSLSYAVTTLSTSETPALPITSSSTVTESTEIIGLNGEITTLTPGSTLLLVTGIDGFVTRLSENDVTSSISSEIIPTANTSQSSSDIKPASVIELSDLLAGNTAFGGDIGLAIQDIVSLITGKKNKTDGKSGPVETTLQDTTVTQTEKTTVQDKGELDSTTQTETTTDSSDSSQPTPTEKDLPEDEYVVTTPKEQDYPIFVGTSNSSEADRKGRPVDALTPVYIASSSESTSSKVSSSDVSKSTPRSEIHVLPVQESPALVSTSVVTGARTVFILPTSMTGKESPEDTHTSEIIIESISTASPTSISSVMASSVSSSTTIAEDGKVTEVISSIDNGKLGVSVVSGVRTVFFGTTSSKTESNPPTSLSSSAIEITTGISDTGTDTLRGISNIGRANTEQDHPKSFTTFTIDGRTIISRTTTGATTIFFPAQIPKVTPSTLKTRYMTSVESITRTLALTTTRTYYTRDSTLTVPSVYTTTIPPRTFVSTIIGSRTILGILPEPTETIQIHQTSAPSERTTTVTTTTLIFNSIPSTVVRTLVLPTRLASQSTESTSSLNESTTESNIFSAGTERPAKPPEVADSTFIAVDKANNDEEVIRTSKTPVQRPRDETYLRAAGPRLRDYQYDVRAESETVRPPIVIKDEGFPSENSPDVGVCSSPCQVFKKEICKESNGLWSCQCRPGHARKDRHEICKEIQTYVVLLKILRIGNSSVEFNKGLADINSNEFKEFEKVAKEGLSEVYQYTNIRDHYLDADVNEIVPAKSDISSPDKVDQSNPVGVIVNFTVQVSPDVSDNLLEQELTRTLLSDDPRVEESLLLIAPLSQSVHDFDECTDMDYNDCSSKAVCENFPGSYSCRCKDEFEDMNSKLPGRECLAKTVNCEYCHGRGDCLESENAKIFCRCLPMYIGRRCEINGLVLAIALPTAVAIVVLLLCTVFCCCRRCRKKSTPKSDPSGMFRGIALRGPVGGTLDRKAMIDTSSESSGEHGRRNSQPFEGYQESGDVTPKKGSKRSDLSLDRSLSTGYTVPPVMIPRARQQQQNHPNKLNYTLYNGQVYVW